MQQPGVVQMYAANASINIANRRSGRLTFSFQIPQHKTAEFTFIHCQTRISPTHTACIFKVEALYGALQLYSPRYLESNPM